MYVTYKKKNIYLINTDYVLLRLFAKARVNIVQERWTIFILYQHYTINYWTILQMLLVLFDEIQLKKDNQPIILQTIELETSIVERDST